MKRILTIAALAFATASISAPASATWWMGGGGCKRNCSSTSTSGGHTSSGGTTSSSGGTQVPEPGMLGLFGVGLLAAGYARHRRRAK
jgi:hypothetical protein